MKKILVISLAILTLCAGPVFAAQYTMKIASSCPGDPMSLPASASLAIFQAKVAEYTDGAVEVKIYPDGQLGDQLSGLQQVKSGELQGSELAMGVMANLYPAISFTDLPYIIPDMKVAQELYKRDNPFMKDIIEDMQKKTGVGILFFSPQSFRNVTNNERQVRCVDDLKGLKIRTMQVKPHIDMFNATGAQAVPIPWLEVYTSLQTGVVDGQENPIATIRAMNFNEVQKYVSMTKHVHLVGAVTYNVRWFNRLPEDIQVAIMKAADEAAVGSEAIAPLYDVIDSKTLTEKGMEIYVPTAAQIAEFKAVMQPPAFDWYKKKVRRGDRILRNLQNEIQRIQRSFEDLVY